jgi:hypothetical protein
LSACFSFIQCQLIDLELQLIRLQEEKDLLALNCESLELKQKQSAETSARLQEIAKKELELQQLQHFQVCSFSLFVGSPSETSKTFRLYRAGIEEYKQSLKAQYSELLESCVRDAVFLSSRNQELTAENQTLQEGSGF